MKRLIKADAAILKSVVNLSSDLAISAIKSKAVNFKEIYNYDTAAGSSAIFGMVSTDLKYIVEFYVYLDRDDERWLSSVVAPIDKIQDGSISSSDLNVDMNHIEKISMSSIKDVINNSNIFNNKGEQLQFSESAIQELKKLSN